MIHGPKFQVPIQYCSLQQQSLLSSPDTSTTEHHIWFGPAASFILGVTGNSPLLFPCSILDTFRPWALIFGVRHFWAFIQFIRFSQKVYWCGLPFPSPVDHVLSELSAMTHPSWVVLQSMAHNFIELCKHLHHDKAIIHERVTKLECVEQQRHHSSDKGLCSKGCGLLSGHVWL